MPAIYDSLVSSQGLTPHKAWRVAYIVPFIIITAIALAMLFLCEDTPTGKWSERHLWAEAKDSRRTDLEGNIVDFNSGLSSTGPSSPPSIYNNTVSDVEKKGVQSPRIIDKDASAMGQMDVFRQETVVALTREDAFNVAFSLPSMAVAIPYACSFGSELAINSILGTYYAKNFPSMSQTKTGQWAAMFGLLNVVCRPTGGFFADILYRATGHVWSKKLLMSLLGCIMGAFQMAIGFTNPANEASMFGLMAGLAFFLEACNGANFAVVPHVHPYANGKTIPASTILVNANPFHVGIVSGIVGGFGNLGGIIFAIIFRYNEAKYAQSLLIIGVISIAANLTVSWIRPVPTNPVVRP